MGAHHTDPEKPFDYLAGLTVFWPMKLLWCLTVTAFVSRKGLMGVVHVLDRITGAPLRLFSPVVERKALLNAQPAKEESKATREQRYLTADRLERDAIHNLEEARRMKQEAGIALGGEDEAKKLLTLPGKNL